MLKGLIIILPFLFMLNGCKISDGSESSVDVWRISGDSYSTSDLAVNGSLSGQFTVAPGRKIVFSQGNLQYQPSSSTWRFARNQYETVGSSNYKAAADYTGWIDMFGWGTSSKSTGAYCFMPYEISPYDDDYIPGGIQEADIVGEQYNADWGCNTISNGGNSPNSWRTLTHDEFIYLYSERPNAAHLYARATVCGVHGLVLLPDNWDEVSLLQIERASQTWGGNIFTDVEWREYERLGAVLLPVTGFREYRSVKSVNAVGTYWTSTACGASQALTIHFSDERVQNHASHGRHYGYSVRLVKDVNTTISEQ